VEPFCGGLAVTLGLLPKQALLNDINPHLMNFYKWLKSGLKVKNLQFQNKETPYYRNRKRFNELLASGSGDSREAAALFYYLNRTGYNGLCRFNRSGGFNVPFGKYKNIELRVALHFMLKNCLTRISFMAGRYDIEVLQPDGRLLHVEVKWDKRAAATGNLYFEVENTRQHRPSGVAATTADSWRHVLGEGVFKNFSGSLSKAVLQSSEQK